MWYTRSGETLAQRPIACSAHDCVEGGPRLKSYLMALSGFVVTVVCCRMSLRLIAPRVHVTSCLQLSHLRSTSPFTFDYSLLSMRPKLPHAPTETLAYIPLLRLLPLTCLYLRGMFLQDFSFPGRVQWSSFFQNLLSEPPQCTDLPLRSNGRYHQTCLVHSSLTWLAEALKQVAAV